MNTMFITALSDLEAAKKSAIATSFANKLTNDYKKIALFYPVIEDAKKVENINNCDATFVYTLEEARQLLNLGQKNTLMEGILRKYAELKTKYDFILCQGICLGDKDAYFRLNLNIDIASNLASPLVCIKDANAMNLDEVISSLSNKIEEIHAKGAEILASIITNFDHADKNILNKRIQDITNFHISFVAKNADIEKSIDFTNILASLKNHESEKITPMMFEFQIMEQARSNKQRIVLAEGEEERILLATAILIERKVADMILIGDKAKIEAKAKDLGVDVSKATIIDPAKSDDYEDFAQTYAELRKAKGVTLEDAKQKMLDCTYYATMMVYKNKADGMVSGAINTTGHTVRPALEFIKTKPEYSIVSGVFFMCLKDRVFTFGDCAINPNPNPEQLAEIAINAADTAKKFGLSQRIAMLSYSTGSSGKGADVDAVIEATKHVKEKAPNLKVEGPIQYDAAINPDVAKTKLPNSEVAGKASIFIFPDLNTGNNTYKAVQRAGNAVAIGPVLQGLNKPVNDLSRGCTVPDIVNTVAITAVQAQK